jgi:uncharacterized protein (DUF2147 family)
MHMRRAVLAALLIGAAPPSVSDLQGNWSNPKGTVEVRVGSCGSALCGTVIAALPSAIADARESGYRSLIGMQLLHDYRADGRGKWNGIVFVPDMGRSFPSHIQMVDANHVRISGCLIGTFLCKSQLWSRV